MSKKSKVTSEPVTERLLNSTNKNYYDIIAMLVLSSVLIIDFFPQFGSLEIIAPQYLYLSFINIVTSLFIFKNPELITDGILKIFKKIIVIKLYIVFLLLCLLSAFTAHNFSLAIVSFTQLIIVFCLFINVSILLHNRLSLIYNITLLISISMFIRTYIDLSDFISVAKSSNLVNAMTQIKGNTGNINIYAASLTGKLPFLLLGIVHFSKWKKWFLSVTLLMATILILLIASRASYIALLLILVGFIIITLKIKWNTQQNRTILTAIVLPVVIAFFVSNFIFKNSENKDRYQSVTNRVMQIIPEKGDDASINIRLKYWENAFDIAKTNPILGIGLGNWKVESIPYEKKISNRLVLSNHAHNDFLEIAAETGFLNLIVYLLLFVFALVINIKNCSPKKQQHTRVIAFTALLLIISYGIDATFNFPLYRTTMQINFCLFLVLTILNTDLTESFEIQNKNNKYVLIITGLSAISLYFAYSTFKSYQFENETIVDQAKGEANFSLTYDEIVSQIPKYPNVSTNSEPYIELAGIYAVKEKKYEQALKYFNLSQTINPYTGRAEWYMYRIYKEQGIVDSAYYYSKKAFEIRPRNEDYYLSALVVDAIKKDTTAILKTHNEFTKYIKQPSSWINTSSALAQSRYPNDRIIEFMDTGLALFPKDTTLLNRKKSFEKDALLAKNKQLQQQNALINSNNLILATQYAVKMQYDKALIYYKKAAIDDPKNIIITQNIGICYFKVNQFKSAILYLEKTLNSPLLNDGKTEYLLGASYLNTKNKEKGCENLIAAENKNYPGAAALVAQYCN